MNNHVPDRWVVLELSDNDTSIRKVFAGWYGGYAGSDNWRLSSGVVEEKDCGEYYEFVNHSGSLYRCYKRSYGISSLMNSILSQVEAKYSDIYKVKILEEYDTSDSDVNN